MIKEYFKPQSVAEAVALKQKYKDEAVFLAGGTDVNCSKSKNYCQKAIGIEQLNLKTITKTTAGFTIGAGVTIQELIDAPEIPDQLTRAAQHFINRNIRNMATIAGNIAANNSTSNLIPILVALDAVLNIGGSDETVPVVDYITGEMTELIESIVISNENLAKKYDLQKFARTANDISIITAAVTFNIQSEVLSDVRVALGGASRHVLRLTELENKLEGNGLIDPLKIQDWVKNSLYPLKDIRGGIAFKKYMAGVLVSDCIHHAYNEYS